MTGGAGYIGSHTILELPPSGFEVACIDNFCNSVPEGGVRDYIHVVTARLDRRANS